MGIQSIRCAVPCCARAEEEQTKCSLVTRIVAVVLGAMALLVGILALSGISTLGTAGGAALTIIGSLTLVVGLCLRCVESQKVVPTLQVNDVRNVIDWHQMIEGSTREPATAERMEAILQAAAISTCPYTKIFVKLA